MVKDSFTDIFSDKKKVMFVYAHPDDAEMYSGGLIARLVKERIEVLHVKMTKGNKGSRQEKYTESDLADIRESEDETGLDILGLTPKNSVNLNLGDGEIENNLETIEKIVRQIRTFKPDLIITHNPEKVVIKDDFGEFYFNHRDHRHTAVTVVDAAYPYSRDNLFFSKQIKDTLSPHIVKELLFVDSWGDPDLVYIDITEFFDRKIKAIASHKSQYSEEKAKGAADYFASEKEGRRYEQFRYVKAD
ncbi:PIG-L family deacetylase [Candidatus Collierbacteria bacterium]|nr:PIG-L family deacetylase [Candidatus Collierbacteria bacterium]